MLLKKMYKPWRNKNSLTYSMSLSIIIILMAVSATQLTSMVMLNGNTFTSYDVYAKYSNDQAQSIVNECDSSNCGNISPQNQADGTAFAPIVAISGGGQGEQGPPGPQGAPGPDKELEVREVDGVADFIPAGERGRSVAECAPGEVATGGGMNISPLQGDTPNTINPNEVVDSGTPIPGTTTNWDVSAVNPGPNDLVIRSFAQCAKLVDAP